MADVSIHNIVNIEIDKYQLDSGTYVCKIEITCESKLNNIQSSETITLFSNNKQFFRNLKI